MLILDLNSNISEMLGSGSYEFARNFCLFCSECEFVFLNFIINSCSFSVYSYLLVELEAFVTHLLNNWLA